MKDSNQTKKEGCLSHDVKYRKRALGGASALLSFTFLMLDVILIKRQKKYNKV